MDYIMDNNEYTQHLQNFYKDTFKGLVEQNSFREGGGSTNFMADVTRRTDAAFKEYSSVFNERFANIYLESLNEKSPTVSEKLNNFPQIYWQTPEGKETLKDASLELMSVRDLWKKAQVNGSVSAEDLRDKMIAVCQSARKVSHYDTQLATTMISHFHNDFKAAFANPDSPKLESADLYFRELSSTRDEFEKAITLQKLPKCEEAVFYGIMAVVSEEKNNRSVFNVAAPKKLAI